MRRGSIDSILDTFPKSGIMLDKTGTYNVMRRGSFDTILNTYKTGKLDADLTCNDDLNKIFNDKNADYNSAIKELGYQDVMKNNDNSASVKKKENNLFVRRKSSIARLGNTLREFQQKLKLKTRKNTRDQETHVTMKQIEVKDTERSLSLPTLNHIQIDNKMRTKKSNTFSGKFKSYKQNKCTESESYFEKIKFHDLPIHRIEHFGKNRTEIRLDEELNRINPHYRQQEPTDGEWAKINQRRRRGRSQSAQILSKDLPKEIFKRNRSYSQDCEEGNVPFMELVERRIHSSKETELCSTDL